MCFISLFHPYALFNDPLHTCSNLGRSEGGILFKNEGVTFQQMSTIYFKYLLEHEKTYSWCDDTLYYYPIIVADAINSLLKECVIKNKKLGEPDTIKLEFDVFMDSEKGFSNGWYGLSKVQLQNIYDSLHINTNRTPRPRFD